MATHRSKRNYSWVQRVYGNVCVYCGQDGHTVDHVEPWSYLSMQDKSNLVRACHQCNAVAGALVFKSFDAKRTYIRNRREELGLTSTGRDYPNSAESLDSDEDAELLIQDAIWEEPASICRFSNAYGEPGNLCPLSHKPKFCSNCHNPLS